jgi:LysR family transcriptional regulator (chromosome initiation inhibitor)
MIDTTLLATLAAVVREGSFERAARALSVSPSAVSQRIRLLEERVGAVLVQRGQPCSATPAGARLCRHAETVTLMERQLRHDLPALAQGAGPQARARIRVAVNADSLGTWWVDALAGFAEEDDALVEVLIADQDQTGAWLRRGQVMAAVTAEATPVQGCRSRRLGALRYLATASPAFVARWFPDGVTAEALQQAPSLVFDSDDRLQERWAKRVTRRELVLPAHRLPSTHAFVQAAAAGLGWGMNPRDLAAQALADGRLVELLPGRPLDVILHWQVATLPVPALDTLTRHVMRAARRSLSPEGAAGPP